MTQEQWNSLEIRFAELSELPAAEQSERLLAVEDPVVRAELESLLGHARAGQTIASAVGAAALHIEGPVSAPGRIGPYRLVRKLGEGGQGSVFEAQRDDGSYDQKVAIKLIRWEADSDAARERFGRERQILAALSHPHIARLLDGGQTPEGMPYIVMDFVHGLPLREAAADWTLQRKQELFLQIASGVAYAHANLIVHRDLKPGNILVTQDGQAMLLDFGIARLLDPGGRGQTTVVALTPAYASPEQVLGRPTLTASDQYSLGVVLYELLTGRRPYQLDSSNTLEAIRIVCEEPPEPPALDEELSAILLMALRKEPDRRYSGIREFADDIRRYLDNRPVLARPDTTWYRTRKYARRHWAGLLATSLAFAGIGVGAGVAFYQARVAQHRFDQVRQLANRFLFDFDAEIAGVPGTVKAREMIVSTARQYLDGLAADAKGDPQLQWELASAYAKVGAVEGSTVRPSLRRREDGIVSYQKALALARPLADQRRLAPRQQADLIDMLSDLQLLFRSLERYEQAIDTGQEEIARSLTLPPLVRDKATVDLANTYRRARDNDKARLLLMASAQLGRDLVRSAPSWENRAHLARSLQLLGSAQEGIARYSEARVSLEEALTLYRGCSQERPRDFAVRRGMQRVLGTLGIVAWEENWPSPGHRSNAEHYFSQSIAIAEAQTAADPKDSAGRLDAAYENDWAAVALLETDPARALPYALKATAFMDAATTDAESRAEPRVRLGEIYRALGNYPQSAHWLAQTDELMKSPVKDKGNLYLSTERVLDLAWGRLEAARGNVVMAAGWIDKAIALGDELYRQHPEPEFAWESARVFDLASETLPAQSPAYRRQALAMWQDQNRRFPGVPYIMQRVADSSR